MVCSFRSHPCRTYLTYLKIDEYPTAVTVRIPSLAQPHSQRIEVCGCCSGHVRTVSSLPVLWTYIPTLMIPFGNQMWCVKENDQVLVDFAVEHLRVSSCHISANYILIREIAMDDVCAPYTIC